MRIVIVDDDETLGKLIEKSLSSDFDVRYFNDPQDALKNIMAVGADVVISDIKMPKMTGVELLKAVKSESPDTYFILITGFGTVKESVDAVKAGAHDYLLKPVDIDMLYKKLMDIRKLIERREARIDSETPVYNSTVFGEILSLAERVAKTDTNVLITGETGCGKEVLARYIHTKSERSKAPFVPFNCGNFQDHLFESELFGYRKGAFTGADSHKRGIAAAAGTGTLFLDEIGEMPLTVQPKLLRFIETKTYYPVGSTEPVTSRSRFVAATNKSLEKEVKEGNFRQDLYFRLNVLNIHIPPLRERKDDIIPLADHFINKFSHLNANVLRLSDCAMKKLMAYNFPGNVRELANIIERGMILEKDKVLTDKSILIMDDSQSAEDIVNLDELIINHMQKIIDRAGGNKKKAASMLGIDVSTIYRKLKITD